MSNYPTQLDTDAEIPFVTDNVTEVSAESINAVRAAIFAIEATLGTNVQGSQQDLKTRLDAILNPDGTFKSAALIAAGLIALPITNSQVGASAAIAESKLDLDVGTQALQTQISSNDIDINALQDSVADILNRLAQHFAGTAYRHDGYAILLDEDYPSSAPPGIAPLISTTVSAALVELKDKFYNHLLSTIISHSANTISVSNSGFSFINPDNVQEAIEQLDALGVVQLNDHRDDMHSNGIGKWANSLDGYNSHFQKIPTTFGSSTTAYIHPIVRKVIEFDGLNLAGLGVKQGDVVTILSPTAVVGDYIIDDVGPRLAIGARSALELDQLEIVSTFASDGYVSARIYGPSSLSTLKGNLAPTIHQNDTRVDSLQVSRPNAARVVSLGINPKFLTSTHSFEIEVGVGSGLSRSMVINGLNLDRNLAVVSEVTIDSLVERLNYRFQNKDDGYAFPAAAYRVGDELMLAHNWSESSDYYLKIKSNATSNTLFLLGLDGYGADVVNKVIRPSLTSNFYVSGRKLTDFSTILDATANVVGQTFSFPGGTNPIALGVKVGHLLHVFDHSVTNECGTYFITAVTSSTLSISKVGGLTTDTGVQVKIYHDAVALDEIANYNKDLLLEIFYDSVGRAGYNIRLEREQGISNVAIVDVSDNFLPIDFDISVSSVTSGFEYDLGADAVSKILPSSFRGKFELIAGSNIESLTVKVSGTPTVGSNAIEVFDHINEEEVLEICSVRFDGALTLSDVVDKRLFGSTGLDELREDVVQSHVETPIADLRSNGIVYGFEISQTNYQSVSDFGSSIYGVLLQGGVAYVGGVRLDIPSGPVMVPNTAGTYIVALNSLGTFELHNTATTSIAGLLDGYVGQLALICQVIHSGAGVNPLSSEDLRFFINSLDDKVELLFDATNRRIGNFASIDAALNYIEHYPFEEKFVLRVISYTTDSVVIPANFKNISLQIDGKIGNLVANSSIRVFSQGLPTRAIAHIDGYVTISSTCADFTLDGIRVSGALSIAQSSGNIANISNSNFASTITSSGSSSLVYVDRCVFSGGSGYVSSGGSHRFTGCRFNSGSIHQTAGTYTLVDGCEFNTSSGFGTYRGDLTEITNSVFIGNTSGTMTFSGHGAVSDCVFRDITQSSGAIISAGGDGYSVEVHDCIFESITLSGTAQLMSSAGPIDAKFSDNYLDTITFTSNPALTATRILNNKLISATNTMLVSCIGDASFIGNVGIHSIKAAGSASDNLSIVADNIFATNTLGYNIDASASASNSDRHSIISNNVFSSISTGTSAILLGTASARISIVGNHFEGSGGLGANGTAINMADASGPVLVDSNYIRTATAFSYSNPVNSVTISNNMFVGNAGTTTTIQVGNDFSFISNSVLLGTLFSLSGISPSRAIIEGNNFGSSGTLTIAVPLTQCSIIGNRFSSLVFSSGGLTNSVVSGNTFGINTSGSSTFSGVSFNDNNITSITAFSSNVTWTNSTFSSNRISGSGNVIFKTTATGRLNVANNIFNGNTVTLTADSSVVEVNFNDNVNMALTSVVSMSDCNIIGNNGTIELTGGLSDVQIKDTVDGYITLYGSLNSVILSGNELTDLILNTVEPSLYNTVNGNNIVGDLLLFTGAGTFGLTDSIITDNTVSGQLNIGSGYTVGSDFNLERLTIARNVLTGGLFVQVDNWDTSVITGNISGEVDVLLDETSSSMIYSNNYFTGSCIINGDVDLNSYAIVGNNIVGDLDITSGGDISRLKVANNGIGIGLDSLTITAGSDLLESQILGNHLGANIILAITSIMRDVNISFNICVGLNMSSVGTVTQMNMFGNQINGSLTLPAEAAFSTGADQSKMIANHANIWDSSGTVSTAGNTFLFPWGNTGAANTGAVVFDGTTATDVITANDIDGVGAGIDC